MANDHGTPLSIGGEQLSIIADACDSVRVAAEQYIADGEAVDLIDARDRLADLSQLIYALDVLRPALRVIEAQVP
jgi:hypothetical protein